MSYDFELGSNQYGIIESATNYPNAFGWSFSVRFRLESVVEASVIFGFQGGTDGNVLCLLRINAGVVEVIRRGVTGTLVAIPSGLSPSPGTWYLATYAEAGRASRSFWTGATLATPVNTDLGSDWQTVEDLVRIGVGCRPQRALDGGPTNYVDGMVAEAGIWVGTTLVQANVDSLNGGALCSDVAGGANMIWRFNSDKGTTSYSADVGSDAFTLVNNPVHSTEHPPVGGGPPASEPLMGQACL